MKTLESVRQCHMICIRPHNFFYFVRSNPYRLQLPTARNPQGQVACVQEDILANFKLHILTLLVHIALLNLLGSLYGSFGLGPDINKRTY